MKPAVVKYLGRLLRVFLGNGLLAYGIAAVYLPANLAVGGSTGVGVILYEFWGIDPAVSVFIINLALLLAGWFCVGKEFVVNTVAGSLAYPLFLGIFQRLPPFPLLETEPFAAIVCGAFFVGAGVGVTLRAGASTGGSDSLAVILNRSVHFPIPVVKMVSDYGVMAATFLLTGGQNLVFSVMALAMETLVMNRALMMGAFQLQLMVISDRYEEIREVLLKEEETGVTMLHGDAGLRRVPGSVVLCVIPNKKLFHVKSAIHRVDPNAFFTIAEVKEVQGQGFTIQRIPQPVGK